MKENRILHVEGPLCVQRNHRKSANYVQYIIKMREIYQQNITEKWQKRLRSSTSIKACLQKAIGSIGRPWWHWKLQLLTKYSSTTWLSKWLWSRQLKWREPMSSNCLAHKISEIPQQVSSLNKTAEAGEYDAHMCNGLPAMELSCQTRGHGQYEPTSSCNVSIDFKVSQIAVYTFIKIRATLMAWSTSVLDIQSQNMKDSLSENRKWL